MENNNVFTRLTLEKNDRKIVWEIPYGDPNGEDMMEAIHTIMVGMTFCDDAIESSMASYINAHSDDYEVIEKNEENKVSLFEGDLS